MTTLTPGANAPVTAGQVTVTVAFSPLPGAEIDVSAFVLDAGGKVRGDDDMCFFGQRNVNGGLVRMTEAAAGQVVFALDLAQLDSVVEKVALTATIYENQASFAAVTQLAVTLDCGIEAPIATAGMQETALILGEFYRRQGAWKFRCVAQGFAGGLEPLARHFGVEVAAKAPSPVPVPPPAPAPAPVPVAKPINLNKITLDKSRSSISLEKTGSDFGEIRINLNWNQGNASGGGGLFASFKKSNAIDLDVGCLFELQNGRKGAVQALGKSFGAFDQEPYIQLKGDDRTGAVSDGEWLHINGRHWQKIRRVLVFAFIYRGVPNWSATDGVVTLYVPGQPPIEVRVSEEGGSKGMCAIALLENDNGAVKVSRRVDFFNGHREVDEAYRWGMRWTAGSK
ncbi:TerD family protein [Azomonas macrocytogenes]|uniref:Tellurite resistance protein TerA n=1 Tax=Azomonas macrocytogenes TaxID=69962 RepID=A0A839T5B2_AZOMA|nr:TerD family protein [Azomonas macrocytogenes]MBB3104229.1 tellurite resistance protein TerA [Azomonas macrocytogenes]